MNVTMSSPAGDTYWLFVGCESDFLCIVGVGEPEGFWNRSGKFGSLIPIIAHPGLPFL